MFKNVDTNEAYAAILRTVDQRLPNGLGNWKASDSGWLAVSERMDGDLEFTARFPVSAHLVVPVTSGPRGMSRLDAFLNRFADELIEGFANLHAASDFLQDYAVAVSLAAEDAIARSRSVGLELALLDVDFKPTLAHNLGCPDWLDAAAHVLAQVHVEVLDDTLRPSDHVLLVEEPQDVADEVASLHDQQRKAQLNRDMLRRLGATALIDEVTMRHLNRYGIEPLQAIATVVECGSSIWPVIKRDGTAGALSLRSSDGQISCFINDDERHVWLQDSLILQGTARKDDLSAFIGCPVTDVCDDALYAGMTVLGGSVSTLYTEILVDQPVYLVDLESGRIWENDDLS